MHKDEYENDRETKSTEIQKCQEPAALHSPRHASVEECRRERIQMFNQLYTTPS